MADRIIDSLAGAVLGSLAGSLYGAIFGFVVGVFLPGSDFGVLAVTGAFAGAGWGCGLIAGGIAAPLIMLALYPPSQTTKD